MTTTDVDPLEFLAGYLTGGPRSAQDVRAAATCVALTATQLRAAARDHLGVEHVHADGTTYWQIPQPKHRRSAGAR